ncbi:glycosyltransferase [Oscillatoria sp. FACHB-1406]|uniref:glycosyltransferase n=1 Tax=Oscillatoria sp. FACHB-1406 TaxID=2692846 RepID=UPI001685D2A1|nr:glycosyltransferase [Oscillatoria sp. FACHB-1406]MBD2579594.1 glycosyltransferase [Oscillatoria sp. FACHB-1406]
MTLISVVIPVYNGQDTIEATLASVLSQSHCNLEVLVINDGSKDRTLDKVNVIKDARLKIYSYPNAGLSASRNRGIERAQGDYISFIDADDLWTPDKLELQLQSLKNNPEAALAYSWTDYINSEGNFLFSGGHNSEKGEIFEKLLVNNVLENGSNALIKTRIFAEVGDFDESLSAAEDWDMWLRIAEKYPFVAVDKPQILYRVSPSSMSANILNQEAQCRIILDRAFSRNPNLSNHLKTQTLKNLYKYLMFKALEGNPSRQNAKASWYCFLNYLRYYPSLLKQPSVMGGILARIVGMLLLSPPQFRKIFNR